MCRGGVEIMTSPVARRPVAARVLICLEAAALLMISSVAVRVFGSGRVTRLLGAPGLPGHCAHRSTPRRGAARRQSRQSGRPHAALAADMLAPSTGRALDATPARHRLPMPPRRLHRRSVRRARLGHRRWRGGRRRPGNAGDPRVDVRLSRCRARTSPVVDAWPCRSLRPETLGARGGRRRRRCRRARSDRGP